MRKRTIRNGAIRGLYRLPAEHVGSGMDGVYRIPVTVGLFGRAAPNLPIVIGAVDESGTTLVADFNWAILENVRQYVVGPEADPSFVQGHPLIDVVVTIQGGISLDAAVTRVFGPHAGAPKRARTKLLGGLLEHFFPSNDGSG